MELVYLYIKEYRNLKDMEFNFCSDIKLSYDKETCYLKEIPVSNKLPNDFWGGNISNLSMIVGNNGAGKTSVMQFIIETFSYIHGERYTPNTGILVVREKKHLYGFGLGNIFIKFKLNNRVNIDYFWDKLKMHDILSRTKVIYHTNTLTRTDYLRNQTSDREKDNFFYDCSVGGNLCKDNKYDIKMRHQGNWEQKDDMEVQSYFKYEQYKQVKFVFDKEQYNNLIDLKENKFEVPLPKKLNIAVITDVAIPFHIKLPNEIGRDYYAYNFFPKNYRQIEELVKRFNQVSDNEISPQEKKHIKETMLKYLLICCFFGSTIQSIRRTLRHKNETSFLYRVSYNERVNSSGKKSEYMEAMEELWKIYKDVAAKIEGTEIRPLERLFLFEKYYYEFIDFIESQTLTDHFSIDGSLIDLLRTETQRNEGIKITVSVKDREWFVSFMQKYRYICNPDYFLEFSWDMSSGECNLLSMFSSLYYVYESDFTNKNNGPYRLRNVFPKEGEWCNSILIMMDEADLSYHPEWQRQYINTLVAFLQKLYPSESFESIQIILSTHSPILLGDMPKQNVFFLENKDGNAKLCTLDQLNTFGQNIHLLFREGFFLEKGTVGKFALDKINWVMAQLKELESKIKRNQYFGENRQIITKYENQLTELQTYIDIIAEPIIKKRLMIQMEHVRKLLYEDNGEQLLSNLSDEELERRWKILNWERERRKHDTNSDI